MSQQKKALIVLGVLVLVFIVFFVSGMILDRGDRPEADTATAEKLGNPRWKDLLEKPAGWFTPAVAVRSIHHRPAQEQPGLFVIDSDNDHAFRALTLGLERISGPSTVPLFCKVTFRNGAPAVEKLREQEDTLNEGKFITLVALKDGGELVVEPPPGSRILLKIKGRNRVLCEKSTEGGFSVRRVGGGK